MHPRVASRRHNHRHSSWGNKKKSLSFSFCGCCFTSCSLRRWLNTLQRRLATEFAVYNDHRADFLPCTITMEFVYHDYAIYWATLLCTMTMENTFCRVQSIRSCIQWACNLLCNFTVCNDSAADFLLRTITMKLYTMTAQFAVQL